MVRNSTAQSRVIGEYLSLEELFISTGHGFSSS